MLLHPPPRLHPPSQKIIKKPDPIHRMIVLLGKNIKPENADFYVIKYGLGNPLYPELSFRFFPKCIALCFD